MIGAPWCPNHDNRPQCTKRAVLCFHYRRHDRYIHSRRCTNRAVGSWCLREPACVTAIPLARTGRFMIRLPPSNCAQLDTIDPKYIDTFWHMTWQVEGAVYSAVVGPKPDRVEQTPIPAVLSLRYLSRRASSTAYPVRSSAESWSITLRTLSSRKARFTTVVLSPFGIYEGICDISLPPSKRLLST